MSRQKRISRSSKRRARLRLAERYESPEAAKTELVRCGYVDCSIPIGHPQKWVRPEEGSASKGFAVARRTGARTWIIVEYPKEESWLPTISDPGGWPLNEGEKLLLMDSAAMSTQTHEPLDETEIPTHGKPTGN